MRAIAWLGCLLLSISGCGDDDDPAIDGGERDTATDRSDRDGSIDGRESGPDADRADGAIDTSPDATVDAGPTCGNAPPIPVGDYEATDTCMTTVEPCGGELAGSAWHIQSLCAPSMNTDSRVVSTCSLATISSVSSTGATGLATFTATDAYVSILGSGSASVTLPNECTGCRCDDAETRLNSAGLATASCSPVCSGGECYCSIRYEAAFNGRGAYTVGDNSLSVDGRRLFDYCVSGDTLTLFGSDGSIAVLERAEPVDEACNGRDDDLDGTVDEAPVDCPTCNTMGVCAEQTAECTEGAWTCEYTSSHREDVESRCDGRDNDCDGMTDELPECAEVCDGVDNDANGMIDDALTESPPPCLQVGLCAGTTAVCRGAEGWVCVYPAAHQPIESSCDGVDNDCDGRRDEGCSTCSSAATVAMFWGADAMPVTGSLCFSPLVGMASPALVESIPDSPAPPSTIDSVHSKYYFVTSDGVAATVRRVNLDGTGLETVFMPVAFPYDIDIDDAGENLYYGDIFTAELRRYRLSTGVDEVVLTDVDASVLRIVGDQVYFSPSGGPLTRIGLDGSGRQVLVERASLGFDVDVIHNRIYFYSSDTTIKVSDLRGQDIEDLYDPPFTVWRIHVDPWTNYVYYLSNFSVERITSEGGPETHVLGTCAGIRELSSFALGGCVP